MTELESLRRAVEQSPSNVPLLLLYGQTCLDELALGEARRAYEEVLRAEPEHKEAQLGVAHVLLLDGNSSEAAVRAERLLRQDPRYAAAHLFLSRVHLSEDDRGAALESFRKALAVDSTVADPALEQELGSKARGGGRRGNGLRAAGQRAGLDEGEGAYQDGMDDDGWRDELPLIEVEVERPTGGLGMVAGLDAVKWRLWSMMVGPMREPELYGVHGRRAGGALLMVGPPGCGKRMLGRSVAAEAGVPLVRAGHHAVMDSYPGQVERNLHQLFAEAREAAPSVLMLDELEGLAPDRGRARDPLTRALVGRLLYELDELEASEIPVLVVGTSCMPWQIDPALVECGRFSEVVAVPPPGREARAAMLGALLGGGEFSGLLGEGWLERLVELTEGSSGHDLERLAGRVIDWGLAAGVFGGAKEGRCLGADELEALVAEVGTGIGYWRGRAQQWSARGDSHPLGRVAREVLSGWPDKNE
jgi:transitional endoplasmic reticulum ATPase